MAWTISACSATDASEPWNSSHSVGTGVTLSFEYFAIASICRASASSMRATGTPAWIVAIVVSTACLTDGKPHMATLVASGMP